MKGRNAIRSVILLSVDDFVEGGIVDDSTHKITERFFFKIILHKTEYVDCNFILKLHLQFREKIKDCGFVEGGMVDGSIDKITQKKHYYFTI